MRKTPLLAAAILGAAVSGFPEFVAAMGSDNPTPPQSSQPSGTTTTKQKTKKQKSSSAKDFLDRYHAAYALIYDKGDYQAGISALRAMRGVNAIYNNNSIQTWQVKPDGSVFDVQLG